MITIIIVIVFFWILYKMGEGGRETERGREKGSVHDGRHYTRQNKAAVSFIKYIHLRVICLAMTIYVALSLHIPFFVDGRVNINIIAQTALCCYFNLYKMFQSLL